jgi:hypothetical protein
MASLDRFEFVTARLDRDVIERVDELARRRRQTRADELGRLVKLGLVYVRSHFEPTDSSNEEQRMLLKPEARIHRR